MNIILLGVMLMSSPAQGMLYMWRDSAGIAHYTNKEYDIPERYKARAKAFYPEATDSGQSQPDSTNSPVAQSQATTSQQSKPPEQLPIVQPTVTLPQIQNNPPQKTPKREKRPRVRSADEE
jgi:hypothetical protein